MVDIENIGKIEKRFEIDWLERKDNILLLSRGILCVGEQFCRGDMNDTTAEDKDGGSTTVLATAPQAIKILWNKASWSAGSWPI